VNTVTHACNGFALRKFTYLVYLIILWVSTCVHILQVCVCIYVNIHAHRVMASHSVSSHIWFIWQYCEHLHVCSHFASMYMYLCKYSCTIQKMLKASSSRSAAWISWLKQSHWGIT
jgi:uncharacterized membrane protein (Fun14 family)